MNATPDCSTKWLESHLPKNIFCWTRFRDGTKREQKCSTATHTTLKAIGKPNFMGKRSTKLGHYRYLNWSRATRQSIAPTSISFPDFFSKRFFLPWKAAERFKRTICACNITAILHPATNNINKANLGFTSNVIKADSEHLQTKQDIFSHFLIRVSLSIRPSLA